MDMNGIIEDLSSRALRTEGTYLNKADGLLYCEKCHTPRQTIVTHPFTGETVKVGCICKCMAEELDRQERDREEAERRERVKRAKLHGFEQSECADMTFAKDDGKTPELTRYMRNYTRHFATFKEKGQGLLLYGGMGTGKTFYSACIANELIERGYSVLMTNFPSLIAKIQRDAFSQDVAALVSGYDLLIVDDLGVERQTDYMREQVFNIVDARYRARKPIIVSTNLSLKQMQGAEDVAGGRIYDRLLERCLPVRFNGASRRRGSDYGDMISMLTE